MSGVTNDTGTLSPFYLVGGPLSGIRLKMNGAIAEVRNTADSAYADLYTGNLRANNPTVGANDGGAVIANGLVRHGTGVQSYGVGTAAVVGNARGTGATDLQTDRTAAGQVASGTNAFLGGNSSTASGSESFAYGQTCAASGPQSVALGLGCTASGDQSFAQGENNTASGANSVAMGELCVASGPGSIAIGRICTSSGASSVAFGFSCAATGDYGLTFGTSAISDARGMIAFTGGPLTVAGDSETCLVTWGRQTLDAVATTAGLDGLGVVELVLPSDATYAFVLLVSAMVSGGGSGKVFTITGGIRRPGAGAAVFVGGAAPVAVVVAGDAALAAATVVVSAPGGGTFRVTVTGVGATTVRWTVAGWIARVTG